MIVTSRRDRNSGDAKVAGTSRSPLLRLPMRSEFFRPSKNQELLAPAAPDCAWFKSIEQDLRRRARLEAECLAEFNQPAALSTYQRGKSVRTTRATAMNVPCIRCLFLCLFFFRNRKFQAEMMFSPVNCRGYQQLRISSRGKTIGQVIY